MGSSAKAGAGKDESPLAESSDSANALTRREVESKATALRIGGASGDEIASALGLASSRVGAKAAERGLARSLEGSAVEHRALDVTRIDLAVAAIWPKVSEGDPSAASALAALLDVRRLLLGLSPVDAAPSPPTQTPRPRRTRANSSPESGASDEAIEQSADQLELA